MVFLYGYKKLILFLRAPDYSGQVTSFPGQEGGFNDPDRKQGPQTTSTQTSSQAAKPKPKVENNNKSFTCTECGKGLARKDKLVS
jgi:hypothetical protein